MIILNDNSSILTFKKDLLSLNTQFKNTLVKEGSKFINFNIFLYDNLDLNNFSFLNIQETYIKEEIFVKDFILLNYLKSGSFDNDEKIYLSENKANASLFSMIGGLFILTVNIDDKEVSVSFPSLKYLSEFLETGESILYDRSLNLKEKFISNLFYI